MAPEAQAALIAGVFLLAVEGSKALFERQKAISKPDLTDTDYQDILGDIVEGIQDETKAHRVAYWAAQNGEKTLDGYSIKKLSMVVEKNANGVSNISREMQNVPTMSFKRNLNVLRDSVTDHFVSNESDLTDDLARVNRSYGCNTMLLFKVHNIKRGKKWTGILCICFEEPNKRLHPNEIGWCSLQVNRIEALISKL